MVEGLYDLMPSFNPILETIIKNIIQKQIGQYVDINKFQLKSFKDVKLENVNLKKDEINRKFLQKSPFFMTYGMIGQMKINIPIQELFTQSSQIEINKVEIHLRPNGNNISHTYFEKWYKDLLNQQEQQKKQNQNGIINDSQYDPDKMNELKSLLVQVALNIKARIKNVIIKLYLQPEITSSAEEVYFMIRISEFHNLEDNKKSHIEQYQSKIFESQQQSNEKVGQFQNELLLSRQKTQEFSNSANQIVTMNLTNLNIFMLKDSSLDMKEYSNLSTSSKNIETEDLKFPFTYPQHNHPTNILHIPQIQAIIDYPLKVHNDNQQIQLEINMHSFEIMVEPYQIKIIGKMLDILKSWKKQVDSLKLLLFIKDENMKNSIIQNNKKWTQQCDFFNSLESSIKNNLNLNHNPSQEFCESEEENMDQILFKSFAEFPTLKKKMNKTESKQSSNINKNKDHKKNNKNLQADNNNNNDSFFNQSIMVQKTDKPNLKQQKNQEVHDLDQCGYLNMSQLIKIIDPQMKDNFDYQNKCNQSQNQKSLSLKFQLRKFCVYVLKGSERVLSPTSSIEYSREWKYTPLQSILSSGNQNDQEPKPIENNNNNNAKSVVNINIPCSYFMLKSSKIEFSFSNHQNAKKIDFDAKSFKLIDVLLMKSQQNHYQFQHFDISNNNKQYFSNQMRDSKLPPKLSSTFWKNQNNNQIDQEQNKFLIKYQIEKSSHYCANFMIYYRYEIKPKTKTHESVKIHNLLTNYWKNEKKEKDARHKQANPMIYFGQDSQFENSIRLTYPEEYATLKKASTSQNTIFSNKPKFRQEQNSQVKTNLFSMVQRASCSQQKQKEKDLDIPYFGQEKEKEINKNQDSDEQSDEEQQPEDVFATISIDKIFINFDMKILHDIALIQSPLTKYAHYSEQLYFELDQKIPKFEVPHEIKKLLKTLNKDMLQLEVKINMLSCNLLTYGFDDYFIASQQVDNIYNNYAQWGCVCETSYPSLAHKTYQPEENCKKQRGSYKPQYLNISIIKPQILVVQKNDLNINFNEINIFSCNHYTQEYHKIIHIGKNFVLTQKSGQNHFELTYPSILKYRHQKDSSKDVSLGKQSSFSNEPEKKLDIQNLPKNDISKESQLLQAEEDIQKLKKSQLFENGNLPEDTFYKDDEQNPDINQVKTGLNIGIPVLEIYLLDNDLIALGDIVFSMKTMMDIIDQFKFQSQKYKNFFENISSKAQLNRDNILIRLIVSELNIYFSNPKEDMEKQQNQDINQQQQQQKKQNFDSSSLNTQNTQFRMSDDIILQECLIFHMKNMSLELLLNKEIKKEEDIKNFKLTVKISLGINQFLLIDNSLPQFLGKNSNQAQKVFTFQGDAGQNIDNFPSNLNIFRVQSVFLKKIQQENILLYKMNLQSQNLNSYQDLYNIMASRIDDISQQNEINQKNISSSIQNKQMILAIKNIHERIVSPENQFSFQMVFKKKQHEQPFLQAKSKQQLDIKALNLNQSVISLFPLLQSNLLINLFENILLFLVHDKINSDIMVKNEFKEILLRDFILFKDVKIDIFPTPSYHQFILYQKSITSELLKSIKSSIQATTMDDRYISNYRAMISIDQLNLINFNKREQIDNSILANFISDQFNNENILEQIQQLQSKQSLNKILLEQLDIRVNKIQIEFLHQVDFNTAIDPFMIDFMFSDTSDKVIKGLGFSQLAILFDTELNRCKSGTTELKIDGIQLSIFKDTAAQLTKFLDTIITSFKSTYLLQIPSLNSLKLTQNLLQQKQNSLLQSIYCYKINQPPIVLSYHPFYQSLNQETISKKFSRNKYMRLNSLNQQDKMQPIQEKQINEKLQQSNNQEEQKLDSPKNLNSEQKRNSWFDDSFEQVNGQDWIIDLNTLQVKEKFEVNVQFIALYLYEGLDFDFKSVNTYYNLNPELYLKPQQKQPIKFNEKPLSQNSSILRNQQEQQQNDQDKLNEEQKNGLEMFVDKNYIESQQLQIPQSNILIVRERTQKKLLENSLLFKIESIHFQMTSYLENQQNIEHSFNISINKLIGENKFQGYATILTEKSDPSDPEQFFNLSFLIETKKSKINLQSQSRIQEKQSVLRKQNQINYNPEEIISIIHTIKQMDLKIHQIIQINLSSQGIEFLLKFLSLNKKQNEDNQSIQDEFWLTLNKNYSLRDKQNFKNNKNNIQNQNVSIPADKQNQIRIEQIFLVDFLFIPKIRILISNKKQGFDFSQLSKKEGLLQIINIGKFSGIEITLVPISIQDKNIEAVGKEIIQTWQDEIKQNQKWQVISKLPLIHNIKNIGDGIFDLFYMPISYYMQGMSVLDGTYQGMKNFVTNTTQESINLTSAVFSSISSLIIHNAKGASKVFNQAMNYFSDNSSGDKNNKNNTS